MANVLARTKANNKNKPSYSLPVLRNAGEFKNRRGKKQVICCSLAFLLSAIKRNGQGYEVQLKSQGTETWGPKKNGGMHCTGARSACTLSSKIGACLEMGICPSLLLWRYTWKILLQLDPGFPQNNGILLGGKLWVQPEICLIWKRAIKTTFLRA